MMMNPVIPVVMRWVARLLALALFLLWGPFFLEHLQEWFLHPFSKGLPPVPVWLMMLAHLGVLVGLLALWKWEVLGSTLAIVAGLAFFGRMALGEILVGHSARNLLIFLGITILPPILLLIARGLQWWGSAGAPRPAGIP